MIGAPHPLDTHSTSSLYILKVFDILYMWSMAIWLQLNTVIACHRTLFVSLGSSELTGHTARGTLLAIWGRSFAVEDAGVDVFILYGAP